MALMPKSKAEWALLVFGILLLLIGFSYGLADWRGNSVWEKYKREWEAKGERFDFASFVPKPVPDDHNFALTSIVASSYVANLDEDEHANRPTVYETDTRWTNTNVIDRLKLELYGDNSLVEMPTNGLGNWARKTTSDLKVWQNYYQALAAKTNQFPVSPQPQSPAADVLLALSKYDSAIEELRTASRLTDSRFPLNYDADPPAEILLPQLAMVKRCSQMLQLRTLAELQSDQADKALSDVKLSFRLIDSVRTEPFLISHLVRIAMMQITLQPVWEGLVEHKWSDAQLSELNQEMAKLDFLADYEFSMRGERALSIANVEHLRRKRDFPGMFYSGGSDVDSQSIQPGKILFHLVPSSVFYQNELAIARMHQQCLLPVVDVQQHIASPEIARQAVSAIEKLREHWSPNNVIACMMLPALEAAATKYVYAQASVDLARTACALERYRLAHGEYPETLDALTPQFIEKVPHDIIGRQPFHYRRTADGKFLLYSVGWNETDDGGEESPQKTYGRIDYSKGDWVWKN